MTAFDLALSAANFVASSEDLVAVVSSVSPLEVSFRGGTAGAVRGDGSMPLTVGDPVRVTRYREQLVVVANMAAYPVLAVVSAYAAGSANCTVVAGDDTFDAQTVGTYTPAVGDRVVLFWAANPAGNAYCFAARRGADVASPPDPTPVPDGMNATTGPDLPTPPPPTGGPQVATLLAQQTASYLTGALFTGDQARYWVYSGYRGGTSGDVVDGAWFYGDRPAQVRGGTVSKFEIWLQRATGVGPAGATDFNLVLHDAKVRTSTLPTQLVTSPPDYAVSLKPGQSGWFTLPLVWGQAFANGTVAGVGNYTLLEEPYKALYGIDHPDPAKRNSQSGALRITYTRS